MSPDRVAHHPEAGAPRLVAAPDKYRGTAGAGEVAAAVARAASHAGWEADAVPMADGGEGTLRAVSVLGGELVHQRVTGPLGEPVSAEWLWVPRLDGQPAADLTAAGFGPLATDGPLAVIEAARAVGRDLLAHPVGDDPVRATSTGVGELVLGAIERGAHQIVVAVGGTAVTDGGRGALDVIGPAGTLAGVRLTVACDVTTAFTDAAAVFAPQKGATPAQVGLLTRRLHELADSYRAELGVDVEHLVGAGAGGGLAGGLGALGARLVPGVPLVGAMVGLARRTVGAGLVVTGEGRLDATSFQGKVVGGVAELVGSRVPLLCVAGDVDPAMPPDVVPAALRGRIVSLVDAVGWRRATTDTAASVAEVVAAALSAPR